jgi:hypothetical protein
LTTADPGVEIQALASARIADGDFQPVDQQGVHITPQRHFTGKTKGPVFVVAAIPVLVRESMQVAQML